MFKLAFETDNAAFSDGERNAEIVRILGEVASRIDVQASGACFDSNGNRVGSWEITRD